jgi:hypothetical protein
MKGKVFAGAESGVLPELADKPVILMPHSTKKAVTQALADFPSLSIEMR